MLVKKMETKIGLQDKGYHGSKGEQIISDLQWRDPLCEAFIKGAQDYGIPYNSDYNGQTQEGVSYVQRTTKGRFRASSAKSFLNPVKRRKNLKIIPQQKPIIQEKN